MVIETSAKQRSEAFARFFRSRVDTFKAEHPEINSDRAVARLMDMPPGTFDKIMHARTDPGSRQPKTIRRLAKIGITEDEITGCGYIVMGMPSDEREPIFDNARACLEHLVEGNGEHPVTSEDIFYMMAPDIVESYDVPTLLPIIRDAMSTRGFKDPVESDFREILTLDARLKAIRDPEYEETMRHQQIGNLFEEIALLNFQISEDYHVPQYCLTPIRDQESGEVTVTTDIIDFIIMRHGADNFLQKAFAEFAENKGDYLKVDGGKIVITQPGNKRRAARKAGVRSIIRDIDPEARRLRKAIEHEFSGDSKDDLEVRDAFAQAADDMDEAIASSEISERTVYALHFIPDGEEKPFHTQYVTFGVAGIPRSTECGQWVRYLNDDGKYIMIHNLDVAGKLASHWQKAMDGIIKEDPDNDSRQWEMSVPYRAVEVKKAGSSDVRGIVKQLKKQKAAILRHREKAPLSIPGMVSGIDVVVLKSNPNLEEALKDDPFFNYVELRQQHYDESFMPFLSQLEHRTLKEVLLLKRFFSRVNYELSQTPTLRTLEEMYSRLLEEHRHSLGYMASRENEHLRGDELIEAVSNMLAASHLKDEQREKAQAAKQLLDDFARYATPAEVVTEEGLKEVFGKHFDSDYRAKGALNSSMIVHEERDGKLASYSRKFGGKKRKFTSMDERALKLIGKFVDDPEEFYDEDTRSEVKRELGKKLAKRKKARDLADRQEKSFGLKFLECRFSDYTSDMEEMVGDSHGAYTRLESGVISMLRARMNGKLPESEIAASEYMLVNGAIQGWRQNYDQLPEHGIERRIVDAINTASKVCDARGGRESSLFEKGRLLGEELYTLMSSVIDKRESFTAKDISEWCSAITEIGIEYSDVLRDHVVGRIDEGSQLALAGRKSIGLDVTACMDIGISDENAGKMFEAMLAKAGIGPEQAAEEGVSANILRAFSPFSREGQQRTVEIRDMFSESVPDAETARESVEKKLGPIIKSQYSEIVSAAITRISMIDEKMLYDRARQMLENTATLAAKTSEHLARDYLSTTAAAVLEFPEVFEGKGPSSE